MCVSNPLVAEVNLALGLHKASRGRGTWVDYVSASGHWEGGGVWRYGFNGVAAREALSGFVNLPGEDALAAFEPVTVEGFGVE